jgi:glucose uptake protein
MDTSTSNAITCLGLVFALWGLWANTQKAAGKYRFELFSLDFAIGALLAGIIAAFTLGTFSGDITTIDNLTIIRKMQVGAVALAALGFTLGNTLFMGAVSIAGLGVASVIAGGAGVISASIWMLVDGKPPANGGLLYAGLGVGAGAILLGAIANSIRQAQPVEPKPGAKPVVRPPAIKGSSIAAAAGLLLGIYPFWLAFAMAGDIAMSGYAATLVTGVAVLLSTGIVSLYFVNLPIHGKPVAWSSYSKAGGKSHMLGILGGILWLCGLALYVNTISAEPPPRPDHAFAAAAAAAVVAALCGLLVWKEMLKAPVKATFLLLVGILDLALAVALVALGG